MSAWRSRSSLLPAFSLAADFAWPPDGTGDIVLAATSGDVAALLEV
jgi:hypothetical protein